MERFLQLSINGEVIKGTQAIQKALLTTPYYWLLECELENVEIEIDNGILIWVSGIMYWGDWKWGVWKSGDFRSGTWNGGIFCNGTFKGDWIRGMWKKGTFKGNDLSGKINKNVLVENEK